MKNKLVYSLLLLVPLVAGAQQPSVEQPPALVEVLPAKSELIAEQIWVPGTVLSRTDANVAAEVSGRIVWMAEVGDLLVEGDVIARLDDQLLQMNLANNQANQQKWQARVTLLERKRERFSSMVEQNATSRDQLDEVMSELEIARQELIQAGIAIRQTEYAIAQSEVKAPFSAMVVERRQTPGEYISVGQTLVRIVDIGNMEASIKAPLSAVPFIRQNMQVSVKNKHNEVLQPIRAIVPVGNGSSRMMEVRVALNKGDFAIGSAVRVALPHSDFHQATTVPRDALVLRKSGAFIYQVDKNNVAQQIPITTGIGSGDRIEVFGNVKPDALVVVRGAELLKAGQKVRYEQQVGEELARL